LAFLGELRDSKEKGWMAYDLLMYGTFLLENYKMLLEISIQ
jgi:hypothetical protein